jgi:hypothetical protein
MEANHGRKAESAVSGTIHRPQRRRGTVITSLLTLVAVWAVGCSHGRQPATGSSPLPRNTGGQAEADIPPPPKMPALCSLLRPSTMQKFLGEQPAMHFQILPGQEYRGTTTAICQFSTRPPLENGVRSSGVSLSCGGSLPQEQFNKWYAQPTDLRASDPARVAANGQLIRGVAYGITPYMGIPRDCLVDIITQAPVPWETMSAALAEAFRKISHIPTEPS